MSWAEAKWTVDSLLQKIGQAPNNMRSFIAYSLSATSIGLKFQEPADSYDANNNLICSVAVSYTHLIVCEYREERFYGNCLLQGVL